MKKEENELSFFQDNSTSIDKAKESDEEITYDKLLNQYGYGWEVWKIIISVVMFYSVSSFFTNAFPTMVEAYQKKYNLSDSQVSLTGLVYFIFKMPGCLIAGYATNLISRQRLMKVIVGILFILNFSLGVFDNFFYFLIARNSAAFLSGIIEVIANNVLCEFLPIHWRSFTLNSTSAGFNLSQLLISLLMIITMPNMEVEGIIHANILFSVLSSVAFMMTFLIYFDSPRNLIYIGENEQAFEILYRIKEKSFFTPEVKKSIQNEILKNQNNEIFEFLSLKNIFSPGLLTMTISISICQFCGNWLSDGGRLITNYLLEKSEVIVEKQQIVMSNLIINIITPFSCFLVGYLSEVKFLGRKMTISIGFVILALSVLPSVLWPSHMVVYLTIYNFVCNVQNLVGTYASEVYPTKIRDLSLGWFNFIGVTGSAISQYILMLPIKSYWRSSIYILTAIAIISAIFIWFSPYEPLDMPLDSIFDKNKKTSLNGKDKNLEEDRIKLI